MCYLESQTLECPIDSVETWSIEMQENLVHWNACFFSSVYYPLKGFISPGYYQQLTCAFSADYNVFVLSLLTPNCRVITIGTSLCVITGPVNSFELNNLKEWKNKHVFFCGKKLTPSDWSPGQNQTAIQKQYPRLWQLLPDKMIIWKLFWSSSVEIKESIDYFFPQTIPLFKRFPFPPTIFSWGHPPLADLDFYLTQKE